MKCRLFRLRQCKVSSPNLTTRPTQLRNTTTSCGSCFCCRNCSGFSKGKVISVAGASFVWVVHCTFQVYLKLVSALSSVSLFEEVQEKINVDHAVTSVFCSYQLLAPKAVIILTGELFSFLARKTDTWPIRPIFQSSFFHLLCFFLNISSFSNLLSRSPCNSKFTCQLC